MTTERTGTARGRDPRRRPSGLRRVAAPEIVALGFVVVVYGSVAAVLAAPGALTSPPAASPSPTLPVPTLRQSDPDLASALLVNRRLVDFGGRLETELKADPFDIRAVLQTYHEIDPQVRFGLTTVDRLRRRQAYVDLADELGAVYADVLASVNEGYQKGFDEAGVRKAGDAIVRRIRDVPQLSARIEAAQLAAAATPTPSPPPAPTPPAGSPTPPATSSVAPGRNEVRNGGFESGSSQWSLAVAPGNDASLTITGTGTASGSGAARIGITATAGPYGIALRQTGLAIEAGGQYSLSLSVRSTVPRSVRLRLVTATGAPFYQAVVDAGTSWASRSVNVPILVSDDDVALEIAVGGTADSALLVDDVALTRVSS